MALVFVCGLALFLLAAVLDRRLRSKRDRHVESWEEFARSHHL